LSLLLLLLLLLSFLLIPSLLRLCFLVFFFLFPPLPLPSLFASRDRQSPALLSSPMEALEGESRLSRLRLASQDEPGAAKPHSAGAPRQPREQRWSGERAQPQQDTAGCAGGSLPVNQPFTSRDKISFFGDLGRLFGLFEQRMQIKPGDVESSQRVDFWRTLPFRD